MALSITQSATATSCGGGSFVSGGCTSCSRPALHVSATYASYNCLGRQRSPDGARDTLLFCKRFHFLSKQGLQWGPSEPAFKALKERFADLDVGGADPEDDSPEDASFLLAEDLQRRPSPRGFGAGTLYDTSIEDELMRDIEGGKAGERKKRQAGDAPAVQRSEQGNGRTRRPPPPPPVEHKGPFPWLLRGTPEDRYPPNTPAGVRVAVGNLPRKKKVGRDLRKALVAVPGLLVIRPAEEGDRDTRDCTCKGSATLLFADQQYAAGFCTSFQGRPIQFGKIERRITAKLADRRNQPGAEGDDAPDDDDAAGERGEEAVEELIEEGRKKGMEQLKEQRKLEEEDGRHALLEGAPKVDEADLQEATVKSPQEGPPPQAAPDAPPSSASEQTRAEELVRRGQEAGAAQLLEQRRREETGGMGALLGKRTDDKHSKEGEDGRSEALGASTEANQAGPVQAGAAQSRLTLERAVQLASAADEEAEESADIDDLFDEADLADAALDEDGEDEQGDWEGEGEDFGEEEGEEDGDWEEDDDKAEAEVEVSDFQPGADTTPRSVRVTKLLDDGTLIVRGQEVGRIDPRAAKDGQLPVPEDVAARIAAVTGGAPVEVDLVTDAALAQKRAFEEKLVAWHFGQLPGFQGAERPSREDGAVTWDRANQTMVRGGGFDKAKHKRLKKLQREPDSLQELAQGRAAEEGARGEQDTRRVEGAGRGEEGFDSGDESEDEEWVLDDSDDEGEEEDGEATHAQSSGREREGGAGPSDTVRVKVGKMDYRELLAAEKRELEAGMARLKAAGKAVPQASPEVLELVKQLRANPSMFDGDDDDDDDEAPRAAGPAKSGGAGRGGGRAPPKRGGKTEGNGRRGDGSKDGPSTEGSQGKKPRGKRSNKPQYGKLIANLQKSL